MLSKVGLKVGAELHCEDTATSGHIALRTGMAFKRCSPGILSRRFATSIAPRDLGDSEAAHSEPECLPSTLSRTSRNNSQDHIEETNLTDGRRVAHPKRKGFSVTMATPTSVDTTEWSRRYSASMVSQRVSMCSNSGTGSGIPCDTGHNEKIDHVNYVHAHAYIRVLSGITL
ncbi:hypothetical protein CAPTEDRAFT_205929 [Capitella teleta]|uniref:Uncharacterized protein n=1 Tax=Capitella teleta TaxID=283909 RepID=R7UGH3_CAPTE|nr:hypothetical protein CAPTEDRAFT_205929 [Capitella teleta]|eukprot:ELU02377.1 hypothetical protein CAPTEDRAFT_205929 [Capitella teleta]